MGHCRQCALGGGEGGLLSGIRLEHVHLRGVLESSGVSGALMCLSGACPGWRPDQSAVAVQGVHSASFWLLRAQVLMRHSPLEWPLERVAVGATVALCLCLREHACGCGHGLVWALGRWWQRAAA